jgi:hypothetical protein
MNIADIHDFIDIVTSQERGGFNTPAEKDSCLWRASLTLFDFYKPNYAKTIEAKEALAPFRARYNYTTNGTGEISISTGFEFAHLLSMDVMVNDPDTPSGFDANGRHPVEFVNEDELAARRKSQNKQPTRTAPIADIVGIGWYNLYPEVVHAGTIYYLKAPAKPVYGYTQVGRNITYNPNTSTQLEWTEPYLNRVIFMALTYLGINLNNEKIVEYASALSGK